VSAILDPSLSDAKAGFFLGGRSGGFTATACFPFLRTTENVARGLKLKMKYFWEFCKVLLSVLGREHHFNRARLVFHRRATKKYTPYHTFG
jgi:hypothetical protein